jgi:hypothetical protein
MNYYEAFNSFDRDGSGTLTADELVGILTRPQGGQAMSQADARAFVAYFDVDGNGALDYDEFCTAMGQPSALGTWQIPAVLPEGPVDAVKFMSTRSLLKALKDVGGHVQVPLERSALEAKYRQTFVEGEPAQQQALETLMGQLAVHPHMAHISRENARDCLKHQGWNVGKALQKLHPGGTHPPPQYQFVESMYGHQTGSMEEPIVAVPMADSMAMGQPADLGEKISQVNSHNTSGSYNTNNSNNNTTTNNITNNNQTYNNQTSIQIQIEQEKAEMVKMRHQMRIERERLEQLEREAERRQELERMRITQASNEQKRKDRIVTNATSAGAVVGFFCAGPLGAAIGAHLGSKHGKERIK